jgi:hypothetical protein
MRIHPRCSNCEARRQVSRGSRAADAGLQCHYQEDAEETYVGLAHAGGEKHSRRPCPRRSSTFSLLPRYSSCARCQIGSTSHRSTKPLDHQRTGVLYRPSLAPEKRQSHTHSPRPEGQDEASHGGPARLLYSDQRLINGVGERSPAQRGLAQYDVMWGDVFTVTQSRRGRGTVTHR